MTPLEVVPGEPSGGNSFTAASQSPANSLSLACSGPGAAAFMYASIIAASSGLAAFASGLGDLSSERAMDVRERIATSPRSGADQMQRMSMGSPSFRLNGGA